MHLLWSTILFTTTTAARPCCGDECPTCAVPTRRNVRTRREVRALSTDEWRRVVDAMNVMKVTSDADGREQYGPAYRSYDSFVAEHYAAATDERGDQAHYGRAIRACRRPNGSRRRRHWVCADARGRSVGRRPNGPSPRSVCGSEAERVAPTPRPRDGPSRRVSPMGRPIAGRSSTLGTPRSSSPSRKRSWSSTRPSARCRTFAARISVAGLRR